MLAPPEADEAVLGLRALAAELGVWLLIGSAMVRREDGKAANRSMLVGPAGEVAATYDKLHMFDVDLPTGERYRESATYEPGDRAVVAEAAGRQLGLTICYDLRFPALYRALAKAGAEILTVPARPSPGPPARRTGRFCCAPGPSRPAPSSWPPAQGGTHEDGRATWGRSMVVAPWGEILAAADHDEPGVVLVELDLAEVREARRAIPALDNARAFAGP